MTRFIFWFLTVVLTIGFTPKLREATVAMAKAAIHAHQHDQMSYAKFTRVLVNTKSKATSKK